MVHQANHHHHLDHQEDKKLNWIGVPLEIQEMDYHHKEKDQIEHQENKNQNLIGILLETLKLNYLLEKDHKEKTLMELQEKTLLDKHQESKNQNLIGVLPETLKPVYHQEKDLIELVPTVVKIN